MKISTEQHYPNQWTAIDADTYDPADDARRGKIIGLGRTEQDAIADLVEQLVAYELHHTEERSDR